MRSIFKSVKSCPIYISKFNMMNRIFIIGVFWLIVFVDYNECAALKRSASPDLNSDDSYSNLDKMNPSYDEYPVSYRI